MGGCDLHLHSTASDGLWTSDHIARRAASLGLSAISITDHDSVEGVAGALEAAAGLGITLIPGVELSAEQDAISMHVLGYFVDHTDPRFLTRLERLRAHRTERAAKIVAALRADGFDVSAERLLEIGDGGAVGRAHIARLLVEIGAVASITEAFTQLLGDHAPYYVPKPLVSPAEVITWIHDAGGVAVLAHPGLSGLDPLIPDLVTAGIIGLEAYHPSHDRLERDRYAAICSERGLVATGGSDFHGHEREGAALGSVRVPDTVISELARARTR